MITACVVAASLAPPPAAAQPRAREAQTLVLGAGGSYLGIGAMDVTSDRAKALNLKEERGVEVSTLEPDGPAAKAGIAVGDVILEFNGQPVEGMAQFRRLIQETPVGRQVKLGIWRNGAMQAVTATIGERKTPANVYIGPDGGNWNLRMPEMQPMPSMPEMPGFEPRMMTLRSPMIGITGEALRPEDQLSEFFGVQEGVLVRTVSKGSAADKAGLKAGDVITKIDDAKVASVAEITRALRNGRGKKTFTIVVVRNKHEMPLSVTIETAGNTYRAWVDRVNC
jgi:serine protease Do